MIMQLALEQGTHSAGEWRCPECGVPCTRPLKCIPCRRRDRARVSEPTARSRRERATRSQSSFNPRDNERIKSARTVKELYVALERIEKGPNVIQISMAVTSLGRMRGGSWKTAVELLRSSKSSYGVEPNRVRVNC